MTGPMLIQQKLPLSITPRGGAIGSKVSLEATGLPPQSNLLIAFANLQSYQLMQRVTTDDEGYFTTTQEVPPWAIVGGVHYLFASFSDERPLALSEGFHVTTADGTVRVRGKIGDQAEGCVELRNSGGRALPPRGWYRRARARRSRHRNRDHRGRSRLRRPGYRDRSHGHRTTGRLTEPRSPKSADSRAKPLPTIGVLNAPGFAPFNCKISDRRRFARCYQWQRAE